MFRAGRGVDPLIHPHITTGLRCADFTVLLKHYKFAGEFLKRERRRQTEGRVAHNETNLRLTALSHDGSMKLTVPGMQADPTIDRLLDDGFLMASEQARRVLGLNPRT